MKKKYVGLTKVQITFGGGMGGSSVTGYARSVVRSSEKLWLIDFVGRSSAPIEMNPRYIVYMQSGYDVYEHKRTGRTPTLYAVNQLTEIGDTAHFEPWAPEKMGFKTVNFPI